MSGAVRVGVHEHITITEAQGRIDAACSVCHQGIEVGARFGIIPGDVLIAEWVKQHAHKPKVKR